jgi:hypothetical protein
VGPGVGHNHAVDWYSYAQVVVEAVINHCSAGTYAYGCTKDVRYRSYVRWKSTGILNPRCGNGSRGQTGTPNMGVITKFEIKGGNKFEINLLPNIKIANYNKLY